MLLLISFLAVAAAGPSYTVDHNALRGRSVIVDAYGREVVFRGINVGVEIWRNDKRSSDPSAYADGKCPSAVGSVNQPPVCEVEAGRGKFNQSSTFDSKNDFAQMRALGFNLIRLAMSWSLIEPEPLNYSTSYLDRIAQVVEWAAEQDIQVVLDMHQDEYGPSIGSDGAAPWACLNVSYPAWVDLLWPKISKAIPFSKTVLSAFDALYMDKKVAATGKGLQEHFLLAWAQVVKRFEGVANVIGYEIINEPPPGIATTLDSVADIPVLGFSTEYLFPMYRRFIQAIVGVRDGMSDCLADQPVGNDCAFPNLGINSQKLVFFEPMALRNQLDFSLQVSQPFTEYKNIVFAPHVYTHFFTAGNWPPTFQLALDSAWFEANLMGAGVLVTEFGGSSSSPDKVGNITNQFDEHRGTSGTMWTWKENGNWGMFDSRTDPAAQNGPLTEVRVQIQSRIYAQSVAGGILKHTFDRFSGSFHLRANAGANWHHATEVYIPPHLHEGQPSVSGMATLKDIKTQPDGSRIVEVMPWITGGIYEVSVGVSVHSNTSAGTYKGVSTSTMRDVAKAVWPLWNALSSEANNVDLPMALASVAAEMYEPSSLSQISV